MKKKQGGKGSSDIDSRNRFYSEIWGKERGNVV